jgi:hypothetical protein
MHFTCLSNATYPDSWLEARRGFPLDPLFSLSGQVADFRLMLQVEGRGERNTVFCNVLFHLS